jgi:hypothetical protein
MTEPAMRMLDFGIDKLREEYQADPSPERRAAIEKSIARLPLSIVHASRKTRETNRRMCKILCRNRFGANPCARVLSAADEMIVKCDKCDRSQYCSEECRSQAEAEHCQRDCVGTTWLGMHSLISNFVKEFDHYFSPIDDLFDLPLETRREYFGMSGRVIAPLDCNNEKDCRLYPALLSLGSWLKFYFLRLICDRRRDGSESSCMHCMVCDGPTTMTSEMQPGIAFMETHRHDEKQLSPSQHDGIMEAHRNATIRFYALMEDSTIVGRAIFTCSPACLKRHRYLEHSFISFLLSDSLADEAMQLHYNYWTPPV